MDVSMRDLRSVAGVARTLIAVDLDGTTLSDAGSPSRRMTQALRDVQALGHPVVVVTGRTYESALPAIQAFGVQGPVVCLHGAQVWDAKEGVVRAETRMDYASACAVAYAMAECALPLLVMWGCQSIDRVTWDRPELVRRYDDLNPRESVRVVTLESVLAQCERQLPLKMLGVGGPNEVKRAAAMLRRVCGDQVSVVRSKEFLVEATSSRATKGIALAAVAAQMGFHADNVIAFGDAENDVSMLRWAGRSFAPVNGMAAARNAASAVIPSVAEDGVVTVLDDLGLLRGSAC